MSKSKSAIAALVLCCGCTAEVLDDERPRADWTDFVEETSPEQAPIDELALGDDALVFEPVELVIRARAQPGFDVGHAQVLCVQVTRQGESLLLDRIDIGNDWSWPCGRPCPVR